MLEIYNADKESEKLIKKVYKAALKYFSQKDIFEVEIEIVDKDEIQSINKEARGVDAVTDVLSFPNLEIRKNLPVKKSDFPLWSSLSLTRLSIRSISCSRESGLTARAAASIVSQIIMIAAIFV